MHNESNQYVISFTEKGAVYIVGAMTQMDLDTLIGLQNNYNTPIPSPIQNILAGVSWITQVSCGYVFSLALSNNGDVMQ